MSARVLATIALISACSAVGTANLSKVCWRSSRKASHSDAVIGDVGATPHRAACVLLRPACGPAEHFRDEIFEACRGNAMVGLADRRSVCRAAAPLAGAREFETTAGIIACLLRCLFAVGRGDVGAGPRA